MWQDIKMWSPGQKGCDDHINTPNHKSRSATRKNQAKITFSSVPNDTILQKVTFAEWKTTVLSATQNIPLTFHESLPPIILKVFPDSQIALKYHSTSTRDTCMLHKALVPFLLKDSQHRQQSISHPQFASLVLTIHGWKKWIQKTANLQCEIRKNSSPFLGHMRNY